MIGPMLARNITIRTARPRQSYDFYTGVLGLRDMNDVYGGGTGRDWVGLDTVLIELEHATPDEIVHFGFMTEGFVRFTLVVADVGAVVEAMQDAGIPVGPVPLDKALEGESRTVYAVAPEGTWIQFCEPTAVT